MKGFFDSWRTRGFIDLAVYFFNPEKAAFKDKVDCGRESKKNKNEEDFFPINNKIFFLAIFTGGGGHFSPVG